MRAYTAFLLLLAACSTVVRAEGAWSYVAQATYKIAQAGAKAQTAVRKFIKKDYVPSPKRQGNWAVRNSKIAAGKQARRVRDRQRFFDSKLATFMSKRIMFKPKISAGATDDAIREAQRVAMQRNFAIWTKMRKVNLVLTTVIAIGMGVGLTAYTLLMYDKSHKQNKAMEKEADSSSSQVLASSGDNVWDDSLGMWVDPNTKKPGEAPVFLEDIMNKVRGLKYVPDTDNTMMFEDVTSSSLALSESTPASNCEYLRGQQIQFGAQLNQPKRCKRSTTVVLSTRKEMKAVTWRSCFMSFFLLRFIFLTLSYG